MDKTVEEIIEIVDGMHDVGKTMMYAKMERMNEIIKKNDDILSIMYEGGRGYHVLGIIGPYAVIEANREIVEHPFTSAYYENGRWLLTNTFWDNMEVALLHAIGCKKEGQNSKFARYASNSIHLGN